MCVGEERISKIKGTVAFVFYNDRMRTFIPLNISYLSAALRGGGYDVKVFDTSFYVEHERLLEEKKKEDAGVFQAVDYGAVGVSPKESSMLDDLVLFVEVERPIMIAFSAFSQSIDDSIGIARKLKGRFPGLPVVFGGIHVNIDPYGVLNDGCVDYICLGEGEEAIVELADAVRTCGDISRVKNIGYKIRGEIKINKCREPSSMDLLPRPDWSPFEDCHIYGPYRGKLLKMALVEYSRTCPYHCAYCGNDVMRGQYKDSGFRLRYRFKSPEKFVNELLYFKDMYGIEFVNIVDGTFLAQNEKNLEELSALYAEKIALPFFCDATVHCITAKKVEMLRRMGCVCVNMGIECSNDEYRRKYLGRRMSNDKIIDSFRMVADYGIETRSYNIIGMPYQTRNDIMDTIELNRACGVGSVSLSIFMPYEGTALRELCVKEGLIRGDERVSGDGTIPMIKNPYLSDKELLGLYNVFSMYVKADKSYWPEIHRAESDEGLRRELLSRI